MNERTIDALNGLIQVCHDGENGYKEAAEEVTRSDLKAMFIDLAAQRQQFGAELRSEVVKLGGEPSEDGTVFGMLHRGWMNIKEMLSDDDERTIVNEVETAEEAAKDAYRAALAVHLPADTQGVVNRQYKEVLAALDRVQRMKVMLL